MSREGLKNPKTSVWAFGPTGLTLTGNVFLIFILPVSGHKSVELTVYRFILVFYENMNYILYL